MSPQEENEIVVALKESAEEFIGATVMPDALAGVRPAEGRWSVIECVEHVAIVEERFLGRLQTAEGEPPPVDHEKEAAIITRALNRANRFQAPEAIQPTGRFKTLPDALEEFWKIRARTAHFASERASDLASLTVTHPVMGLLNGREALILIAGHARRHAAQIRETVATLTTK